MKINWIIQSIFALFMATVSQATDYVHMSSLDVNTLIDKVVTQIGELNLRDLQDKIRHKVHWKTVHAYPGIIAGSGEEVRATSIYTIEDSTVVV